MSNRQPEERALSIVTEEARRECVAAPQQDALEQRILAAISARPRVASARARRVGLWIFAPVAAIALAASVVFFGTAPEVTPARSTHITEAEQNGDALPSDRVLRAMDRPLQVRHGDMARWTLAPGSRAKVVESGDQIHIHLLSGSLRAQVTPSPDPERFVVYALDARVAVHGTVFRVALESNTALVEVEEGLVSVGPNDALAKPVFLKAPASARFEPDGRPRISPSERPRAETRPPARRLATQGAAEVAAPVPSESEPRELTIGEVEAGVTTLVQGITRCFQTNTIETGDVTVRARTSVTVEVNGEGSVQDVRFTPPLSPAVQACADRDARTVRFAPAGIATTITRVLELTR